MPIFGGEKNKGERGAAFVCEMARVVGICVTVRTYGNAVPKAARFVTYRSWLRRYRPRDFIDGELLSQRETKVACRSIAARLVSRAILTLGLPRSNGRGGNFAQSETARSSHWPNDKWHRWSR